MLVFARDLDPIRIGHLGETDLCCLPDVFVRGSLRRLQGRVVHTKHPQFDEAPETIRRVLSIAPPMQYVKISNRR
jgi:hypothetical protein